MSDLHVCDRVPTSPTARGTSRGTSVATVVPWLLAVVAVGTSSRCRPAGFRAVVYAGLDPLTGKRRNLTETATTYDLAEVALAKHRHLDEQQHPKSAITVREAIEQWLEVAELGVTTREQYDDLVRLYIDPTLGKMQAGRLDAELLERFYGRLLRCKKLCSGRPPKGHQCVPLGPSVRKVHYICGRRSTGRCGGGIWR